MFYQYQVCNVLKVKRRNEVSESPAVEETVKKRRVEVGAETSCQQSGMDRSVHYKIVLTTK